MVTGTLRKYIPGSIISLTTLAGSCFFVLLIIGGREGEMIYTLFSSFNAKILFVVIFGCLLWGGWIMYRVIKFGLQISLIGG